MLSHKLEQTKLLDLSRQQRNLLLMRPVFDLEAHKLQYQSSDSERKLFEGIDTPYLVLSLLDDLMEAVAVGSGRTTNEVIRHSAEVALSMYSHLSDQECIRIGEIVLDAIANRSDKHKSFEYSFYDSTSKANQIYRFKLIDYAPDIADSYRFVPTREGYLVYLGMLDLSPEDSAELMEKMLQLLIDRGRFSEAIEIAKKARTISIEFSQKIREMILRARKAPSTINWKEDIHPRLSEARTHVLNRQKEDTRMSSSVQSSIENAQEYSVRQNLSTLRKMLMDSHKLRGKLLHDIMCAPEQFLEAQRSLFKVKVSSDIPDLENLLLPQVMRLPLTHIAPLAAPIISSFMSINVNHLFDLNTATQLLLEKRDTAIEIEIDDEDISTIVELHNMFSPDEIQLAKNWLTEKLQIISNSTSEALLRSAQSEGLSEPICQCIAIMLYQLFSSEDSLRIFDFQVSQRHFQLKFASGTVLTISRRKELQYDQ